ncbi:MAG: class I SAM-dependent methyltransferase [Firmicutes bacterium]|nr:class I SAM-dependent methyltransferase [Bacillota bacterium]
MTNSRDTREKLAKSLTAKTTELIPFLPYLLQDLWELGSIPGDIEALIREHVKSPGLMSVLDLACGKGAVSVHLAKVFGCRIKGIDFFPEFIEYARRKAGEFSVSELCKFQVGDINEAVLSERGFDMVIFGSVGDVLGNYGRTLNMLRQTVKDGGYIIIDDAYNREEKDGEYLSIKGWLELFRKGKVDLLACKTVDELELAEMNAVQQASIRRRAEELKLKYPGKSHLFDGYVASQQAECDELAEEIMGITWLLKKQKTENA